MTTGRLENRRSRLLSYKPQALGSWRCDELAAAIAGCVPNWSVDLHYDEEGKPTIVVMPEDHNDTISPTLIVYANASAFHIDELRGDAYRNLGEHDSWADVLRAVRIRLIWEEPFPTTLH